MLRVEHRGEDDLQINMAPMIDMVFLLIIFFLTATTFTQKEREQDVLLPLTKSTGSLSKALERNLIINVKKNGDAFVAGRQYEKDKLQALVASQNERSGRTLKVMIRGDRRASWGSVAEIFKLVARAGVARPYVDYKEEQLGP